MNALALVLSAATALAVSGRTTATVRLRAIQLCSEPPRQGELPRPGPWQAWLRALARQRLPACSGRGAVFLFALTGLAVGLVVAGPVVGAAGAVALAGASWLTGQVATARANTREHTGMIEALAALTGELRAGCTPADALRVAASVAAEQARSGSVRRGEGDDGRRYGRTGGGGQVIATALAVAAATAAVGGDVPGALRAAALEAPPGLAGLLHRVAAGWQVSLRSGASLAEVLELVELDARARAQHARHVAAQLAGPRATAGLLAVLPGVGMLLGVAMGADPLTALAHTAAGQFSLVTGVTLDVAGAVWTLRLVGRGAPP